MLIRGHRTFLLLYLNRLELKCANVKDAVLSLAMGLPIPRQTGVTMTKGTNLAQSTNK